MVKRYRAVRSPAQPHYQLALTGDANLRAWITEPGSMTQAIASHCGGRPQVVVHKSALDRSSLWEAQLLRLKSRQRVFTREISLQVDGRSVLNARSVAVAGGAIEARLRGLGNKPLAELLFEDPLWQRQTGPLGLAGRSGHSPPGRVCVWRYRGRQPGNLLVAEYFLPELLVRPRVPGGRISRHQEPKR
jgi:chorismate-pyruvate lyase